jgi:polyhydroxybutyrate depolymerase
MADDIDRQINRTLTRVDSELRSHEHIEKILSEINDELGRDNSIPQARDYLRRLTENIYQRGQFPQLAQAYLKANFDAFDLNHDGYIGSNELQSILTSRLLNRGTTPFEKEIIEYTKANFQAIADASNDEWERETRISRKDLDAFPALFAQRAEKRVKSHDMLAQFGTPELFARLHPTDRTAFSRIPLLTDADLRRAASNSTFSDAERQTIQFMIDHRSEIARVNNDQWGRETEISLKDIQGYANLYKPEPQPQAMANVDNMFGESTLNRTSFQPQRSGPPSTQEICSFVEQNFGMLDLDGNHYITKEEVNRLLNTDRWRSALSDSDRRTLAAFGDLVDTMQKAHHDEWYWYKDTHGVSLRDVQEYARQDQFNHRDLPTTPGDHHVKFIVDGVERDALVHIPPNYDGKKKVPEWLFLHCLFSDNQEMPEWTSMTKKADEVGAVIVYPNARGWLPEWSPLHLREWTLNNRASNRTDDLNFIRTVMDATQQRLSVDRDQTYVIGYSNGGMLAHEVAARMPDRIAAAAIVGSTQCGCLEQPQNPVSILMMNGTSDPLVPPEGRRWPARLGFESMRSVADCEAYWRKADGATESSAPVQAYPGVTRTTYRNPSTGHEVVQYQMLGSGHCWPGAPSAMFGPPCTSMSAPDVIADFFARHRHSGPITARLQSPALAGN